MVKSQIIISLISVLISSGVCFAQIPKPTFSYLTIKEGLSQSTVEAILHDKKGFMWFATNDGLNKYDGYDFTTFRYESSDTSSISDNYVYGICEDDSGFIWVATNNGLNKYDPLHNKFTRFQNNPNDPYSLSFNLVQTVLKDKNNNIWAGTLGGGLNVLNQFSGKFNRLNQIAADEKLSGFKMITSLYEDNLGNIWAGTYNGNVIKIIIKDGNVFNPEFLNYNFSPGKNEINENIIWDIKQDKTGTILIATNRTGVVKLNPDNGSFATYAKGKNDLNDISVRRIFVDENETIYFGTKTGGLNILNPDGKFTYIESNGNAGSLNDNSIWSIYKDRKGTLWIGTEFGGVNKYDPLSSRFEHFSDYSTNIRKHRVLTFCEIEDDHFYIGTDGGLISFDYIKKKFTNIPGTEKLENEIITAILEQNNYIWIGTNGSGIYKFQSASNDENRYNVLLRGKNGLSYNNSPGNNNIKVMIKSGNGNFWIGTYGGGVVLFDPEAEKIIHNLSEKGINEKFIYALLEDENYLWIGTYGDGLIRYNFSSGERKNFIHQQSDLNSISNNRIYSLYLDYNKNLWVGTAGGLNLYNSREESFTSLTSKDGIVNNVIYSILEDDEGFLWLSTNKGISRLNVETKSFINFGLKDGLQDYEFNRGAHLKSLDGKLIFGGINGFNVFKPTKIEKNNYIPPVVITSFRKMNREIIFPKAVSEVDTIILSYNEKFFSFTFAALDYTHPEINNYKYKMEGFNEDWVLSGNDRTATYTNLDPGSYVFRVKGSNNDGVWNEVGASVSVIILPPWWLTWWFRTIVVVLMIGILYSVYKIKLQRVIEIERLRTRIASDLHDDIGSNLTHIAIQSDLILEDVNRSDYKISLKDIGEKSREIVTTMSDVVWSIDARNDSAGNLLDRMKEFSHSMLSGKNISVSFYSEGISEDKKLPVNVRQNIYLIFKEAVNNIAKHSGATEVKLFLKNSAQNFEMRIYDNGNGRELISEKKSTGHGLKNMKMRAERIGGKIEIKNVNGFEIIFKSNAI